MLNIVPPGQVMREQAIAAYRGGDFGRAAVLLRRAAAQSPKDVTLWDMLGLALLRLGNWEDAVTVLQHGAGLQDDPKVLNNLGVALMQCGRHADALEPLEKAHRLSPQIPGTRHNLAKVLTKRGRIAEALGHLEALLAQTPDNAELHLTRGIALSAGGQSAAAVAELRLSMKLGPTGQALDHLLMALHEGGAAPEEILGAAREVNALYKPSDREQALKFRNDRSPERKLRVGYLSADLFLHPVATFLEPLLAHHDRERVEVLCYAAVRRADAVTERLRESAGMENWREVSRLTDKVIGEMMRRDGIDILVDLGGHAPGNRLSVAAHRPAPVIVTHLGYPSTTGLAAVQYRLTDGAVDTAEADGWHSEELVRLKGPFATYMPPGYVSEAAPLPALARGHCTFGVFASRSKISRPVLEAWAALLGRVPGSKLRMQIADPGDASASLLAPLLDRGISRERVEILPRAPVPTYMAAHGEVDILLDTFPLSGHTTICNALWMGVPAVCLEGRTCWERLGASVMKEAGLGEWVACSVEEYVERAVQLAGDQQRLRGIRASLRQRMLESRLMDYAAHAEEVEAAYRDLWRRWCAEAGEKS